MSETVRGAFTVKLSEVLIVPLGVAALAASDTVTLGVKAGVVATLAPIVALQVSVVTGGPFVTHAKPVGKLPAVAALEVVIAENVYVPKPLEAV